MYLLFPGGVFVFNMPCKKLLVAAAWDFVYVEVYMVPQLSNYYMRLVQDYTF